MNKVKQFCMQLFTELIPEVCKLQKVRKWTVSRDVTWYHSAYQVTHSDATCTCLRLLMNLQFVELIYLCNRIILRRVTETVYTLTWQTRNKTTCDNFVFYTYYSKMCWVTTRIYNHDPRSKHTIRREQHITSYLYSMRVLSMLRKQSWRDA